MRFIIYLDANDLNLNISMYNRAFFLFPGIFIQFVVLHIFDPRQLQQFLLRRSPARRRGRFQNFTNDLAVGDT